jgi:hypothetical protein
MKEAFNYLLLIGLIILICLMFAILNDPSTHSVPYWP